MPLRSVARRVAAIVNLRALAPACVVLVAMFAAGGVARARGTLALPWLAAAWLGTGAAVAAAALVGAALAVRRAIRSGAVGLDAHAPPIAAALRARGELRARVLVGTGEVTGTIGLPGLGYAVVLAPEDAEVGSERHRAILLHELGHVRRRDPLRQLLTDAVFALAYALFAAAALGAIVERGAVERALRAAVRLLPEAWRGPMGGGLAAVAWLVTLVVLLSAAAMLTVVATLHREATHAREHAADAFARSQGAPIRRLLAEEPPGDAGPRFPFADHPSPWRRVERLDQGGFAWADSFRWSVISVALLGAAPALFLNLVATAVVTTHVGEISSALGPLPGSIGSLDRAVNERRKEISNEARDATSRLAGLGTAAGEQRAALAEALTRRVGLRPDGSAVPGGALPELEGTLRGVAAGVSAAAQARLGVTQADALEAPRATPEDGAIPALDRSLHEVQTRIEGTAEGFRSRLDAATGRLGLPPEPAGTDAILPQVHRSAARLRDALDTTRDALAATTGGHPPRDCAQLGREEIEALPAAALPACVEQLERALALRRHDELVRLTHGSEATPAAAKPARTAPAPAATAVPARVPAAASAAPVPAPAAAPAP